MDLSGIKLFLDRLIDEKFVKWENDRNEIRDIALLKEGDITAFERLFGKYAGILNRFSQKIMKSGHDADEVVQDTFLKIWEKRHRIDPDQPFRSYLFTIALNIIRKRFLDKARENHFKVRLYDELLPALTEEPEEKYFSYYMELVDEEILKLPEKRKQIFILHKKEGLTVPEIAGYLNLSPKTIENQITAALKTIRDELFSKNIKGLYLLFMQIRSRTCLLFS